MYNLFENSSGDLPEEIAYPYYLVYFKDEEFKRCTPSCSIMDMNPAFMRELDRLRSYLKRPIIINSAFRSVDYELRKGRSGSSSHCKGLAVDIRCDDSDYRLRLLTTIFGMPGLSICRVGIGENFVHLDCDPDKPPAIWTYNNADFWSLI